jgi:hypothetical protein
VTSGWFFPFLNSLLEGELSVSVCTETLTTASSVLCVYINVVLAVDGGQVEVAPVTCQYDLTVNRRDEARVDFSLYHVPKLIVVALYGILSLILYAWVSIRYLALEFTHSILFILTDDEGMRRIQCMDKE